MDRPINGTTDWRRYEVVLDVAEEARAIAFGVLLVGAGTAYISDARLETVDRSVPTTPVQVRAPQNLDFRE
jgi:hypothetical protein